MGYRAHTITQPREYGSSIFGDYEQFEKYLTSKIDELYPDNQRYMAENQEYFELDKEIFEKEIIRLSELGEENEFEFQSPYYDASKDTNGDIIQAIQLALDESPKDESTVCLEWF